MVTTEVCVTAEAASTTSDNHSTPPATPTPSIAPVLPTLPPTHHQHHPWASPPSPSGGYLDDDLDLDLDLHYAGQASTPSSRRVTRTNTATRTDTTTTGPPFTTVSTVSSTHHIRTKPQHTRNRPKAAARPNPNIFTKFRGGTRQFITKLRNLDPVKLAYLRTSFVFAISILITWAPSSINRVYTLINPTSFNYGLNMASAVVLPLQGVWNCVIYCATSWYVLVDEIRELGARIRGGREGWGGDGVYGARRREERRERERGFELNPRGSTMRVVRGGSF